MLDVILKIIGIIVIGGLGACVVYGFWKHTEWTFRDM